MRSLLIFSILFQVFKTRFYFHDLFSYGVQICLIFYSLVWGSVLVVILIKLILILFLILLMSVIVFLSYNHWRLQQTGEDSNQACTLWNPKPTQRYARCFVEGLFSSLKNSRSFLWQWHWLMEFFEPN